MKRIPAKYLPLVGIIVGAIGGGVYWLAAQFWPSSVAVVLSLFATTLLNERMSGDSFAERRLLWTDLFALLITYNALMALTAANPGFPLPANLALGLVLICGQAASRALAASVLATRAEIAPRVSVGDLSVALVLGFPPSIFLGIPGLIGLAAAIILRLAFMAYVNRLPRAAPPGVRETARQLAEACFYLGALAAWNYI